VESNFGQGTDPKRARDRPLGLYQLLDPDVLADPYPLYQRLRIVDPVCWDPFLHTWVVTRYADVMTVLQRFSANCTPSSAQLDTLGMQALSPIARVMGLQMLFLDPPEHSRIRGLAAKAFAPGQVEAKHSHIAEIVDDLMRALRGRRTIDLIADVALPLPAIISAEMLGLPVADWPKLTQWSRKFSGMLGGFQYNADRATAVLESLEEMTAYFRTAIDDNSAFSSGGLIQSLATAEIDGDKLSHDEVIANAILTMVGGQETTTTLIGNGMLSLLVNPDQWQRLRDDPSLIPSAVEELLRFESPSQHTARVAREDCELSGNLISKGQVVTAVIGAANRDPERFEKPDQLDLERADNRHLAFGWGGHFCFGAPLARMEGQLAFAALAEHMGEMRLVPDALKWKQNHGLRGLETLLVEI
jgi:pimeloyl-[acyl-carrier protein] synthase